MIEDVSTLGERAGTPSAARGLDRWARARFRARLRALEWGSLTLVDGGRSHRFGDPDAETRATIQVRDPRFYRALALRGSLGAPESYMDGHWRCDDLTAAVRIMARNAPALRAIEGGVARLARPGLALLHAIRDNTRWGARRNVAAHYDLGNEFFSLFLDPTLTYSCGIFERADASMQEASVAKYERACRKLRLAPDDHVLEIGGGWGGFALHAAGRHGCRVTTTTISRAQHDLARRRVAEAGLGDRIDVRLEDYRDLRGRFDKLVSIEMIEAVGHRHLDAFFRTCSDRLRSDGAMLLQAITVRDQDWARSRRNVDFVKRYIFPGGQLVSLGAVCRSLARAADLRVTHLEDLTPHYAETLRRWRTRMFENIDRMRGLGLPQRFLAMWEFYLCYCEGGFRERANGVVQVLLEKPEARRASPLGQLA